MVGLIQVTGLIQVIGLIQVFGLIQAIWAELSNRGKPQLSGQSSVDEAIRSIRSNPQ